MNRQVTRSIVGAVAATAVALSARDAGARVPRAHHATPDATVHPDVATTVSYWGGRVLSSVQVVAVFWTSSVDAMITAQIGGFYTTIVKSSYIDWLTEYDSIGKNGQDGKPGSSQHIGRGAFVGSFTITPANKSKTLQDTEVSTELAAQIQSGALPLPKADETGNVDTLYMIEFPTGYSISEGGGSSCSDFGGYHSSTPIGGSNVPYAVLPDCGAYGETYDEKMQLHSHELVEAITDPEIGAATGTMQARPLAWMSTDSQGDEIGDLCEKGGANAGATVSTVLDGYTVQLIWSNYAGACIAGMPICDGSTQPPKCRSCTANDDGAACSGATPQCDTATGFCKAAPPPVVDAGTGTSSSGSGSGSSSGSGGGSSGSSGGGASGGSSSSGGSPAPTVEAGAFGQPDAGDLDSPFGRGSTSGCRLGGGGEGDLALVAGAVIAAARLRRRRRQGSAQARTR